MAPTNDLPIALRRTPRRVTTAVGMATTPGLRKKGTLGAGVGKQSCPGSTSTTAKQRTSSSTSWAPAKKRPQRVSNVGAAQSTPSKAPRRPTTTPATKNHNNNINSNGEEVLHILPLRAVLDDRVKRRIRRHGLSEEMHRLHDERRRRAQELEGLRGALAATEAENERLREESSLLRETSRYEEERDWDMAAADGFTDHEESDDESGGGLFGEDGTTVGGESTRATTPLQGTSAKPVLFARGGQTLTPPATSPAAVTPSPGEFRGFPPAGAEGCDAGVQACFGEEEVDGLREQLGRVTEKLAAREEVEARVRAKLAAVQQDVGDADWQLQVDVLLQTLAERTAVLAELNASVVACTGEEGLGALEEAFQSARRDLVELCPDVEMSSGVDVLAAALGRLREVMGEVEVKELAVAEGRRRVEEAERVAAWKDVVIAGLRDTVEELEGRLVEVKVEAEGERRAVVARLRGELMARMGEAFAAVG